MDKLPIWHPSRKEIACFFGDICLANIPLDIDDAVVNLDEKGAMTSEPSAIVAGYTRIFP